MTNLTAVRPAALRNERDPVDSFAVFALALSFALAMLGLVLTAHPRSDTQTADAAVILTGP